MLIVLILSRMDGTVEHSWRHSVSAASSTLNLYSTPLKRNVSNAQKTKSSQGRMVYNDSDGARVFDRAVR